MREPMTTAALLIDFGSTYTKLRAIDLDRRRVLGSGQGPSTVASDIMVGMKAALADVERRCRWPADGDDRPRARIDRRGGAPRRAGGRRPIGRNVRLPSQPGRRR